MERLTVFDANLSQYFTLSPQSSWWPLARFVAHLGDGHYVFALVGLAYLVGWLWPNPGLRQAAVTVGLIIVLTTGVVTLIKYAVRRQRPRPPGEFVSFRYDLYSFPSGHSARMAALAISTVFFYPFLGWVLAAVTIGVAAARLAVGVHFLSDIIAGLGVGVLVAWVGTPILLRILDSLGHA